MSDMELLSLCLTSLLLGYEEMEDWGLIVCTV
jgi:hypothetical protein